MWGSKPKGTERTVQFQRNIVVGVVGDGADRHFYIMWEGDEKSRHDIPANQNTTTGVRIWAIKQKMNPQFEAIWKAVESSLGQLWRSE